MDPRLLQMPEYEEIDMTEWEITLSKDIVKTLSKNPQLKSLKASDNKLTQEAAGEFSMSQLQKLHLSRCGIDDTVCVSLMISLSKNSPLLEELNISYNCLISDKWCDFVQMKKLREINLSKCGTSDALWVSLMSSLSKQCPLLEELNMSYNNLTSDEWCHHVQMKQLRKLDLSQCGINDTVCVSLMISLSKHCPLLEILILDGNFLSSNDWCQHVQMEQLRKLYLYRCRINDTVCVSLMISLSKHCPLLEVLIICCNNLKSDKWCHHVQMKQLRELNLCDSEITDTVCVPLMISLSKYCPLLEILDIRYHKLTSKKWCRHVQMRQLRELNLSNCDISDTVCESLMTSLSKQCPLLEILYLSCNNLTSDKWCHQVQMKQLTKLYLFNCGINDTVCVTLMISLSKYCPLLEVLILGSNNLTSDEWCRHVQMKKLKKLDLNNCGMSDTACMLLVISLSEQCPLLEVLHLYGNNLTSDEWCRHVQMKHLRELNLSRCGIVDNVCVSLMISLSKHSPLLEILDLSFNEMSSSGVWKIVDYIKHMRKLREMWLYKNPCMEDEHCRKEVEKKIQESNPGLHVETGYST